ncbi:MAG: hypothetical protein AAF519_03190, partial [Bacteroidota bacterium]
EKYKEDLSYLRPTYPNPTDTMYSTPADSTSDLKPPVAPTFDVTAQLNAILDSIDVIRKDQQFVDGYTIQVYSGGDSEEATKARGKVYSILEGAKPSLKFEEPNFKVKVGEYYSRLEAQKDYALLKRKFSLALIIPERIYIQ